MKAKSAVASHARRLFRIPHSAFRIEEFVFMAKGVVGQLPA